MLRLTGLILLIGFSCLGSRAQSFNKKWLLGKWRMQNVTMASYTMDANDTALTVNTLFMMRRQQAAKPFNATDSSEIMKDALLMMGGLKNSYIEFTKKGTFTYLLVTSQESNQPETGTYIWSAANTITTRENDLTSIFTVEKLTKKEMVLNQAGDKQGEAGVKILFIRK